MSSIPVCAMVSEVAPVLLDYLRSRLKIADLEYAEPPVFFPESWETYIFRFRLAPHAELPQAFQEYLILRAYSSGHGWPRLRHEYQVQEQLCRLDYPVPRPLLLEREFEILGGPFMLMEGIPGRSMLSLLLDRFTSIFWAPARMAKAQARLHELPTAGFPASPSPFLDRRLRELTQIIDEYDLPGLIPGMEWLHAHRLPPAEPPRIVHLDFHPANLIFESGRCRSVVDWCESDLGDRHADLAASLLLIDSTPLPDLSFIRQMTVRIGRFMLHNRYLRAYRRILPVDKNRLRYFLACATLRRLARWGMWLRDGPLITGSKPSALGYVTPQLIGFLENYFHKHTGVSIRLESSPRARRLRPALPPASGEGRIKGKLARI
jgi:aminoglycoside phosphotransferase (APT) family kinase protein